MIAINKYNQSMIYTIRSPQSDKYYIGSTTQILCKRMSDHNTDYKRYLKGLGNYVSSYKILELGGAYIELLEEVNCENRNQLEKREGELMRDHKEQCINKNIAGRAVSEYNELNKENRAEYNKEYYKKNFEKVAELKRVYRQENKDKMKIIDREAYLKRKEKTAL